MMNTKLNKAVRVGGLRRRRPNYGSLTDRERKLDCKKKITSLFKGKIQNVDKVDACSFEYEDKISIFENPEFKVMFDHLKNPFAYYFSCEPKDIMTKNPDIPDNFEEEVAKLNTKGLEQDGNDANEEKEKNEEEKVGKTDVEEKVENISDEVD
ncbi:hypothetical protein SLOPH_940 [Spraguea lophii 42_110]|uniref:Uncharacterized protein n=1 Tax=Spraguea lophii (strain 42_110) TaxID=1358809 RepID=S7XIX1_SPRLO|nr:hypothetical protein SLOPH_940 [Spraguea lophii 42_110]